MHQAYLDLFCASASADRRVRAAWIAGSFGRGEADRYSDLDLHVLIGSDDLEAWKAGAEAWLRGVRPLVLFRWLFDNYMINALTVDGLGVDLVPHAGATISLDAAKARLLFERDGAVSFDPAEQDVVPAAAAQTLLGQVEEFWRCIALVPVVFGRDEVIVGVGGLSIEVKILTDFILLGNGIPREGGAKRLNALLPDGLQQRLEGLLSICPLTSRNLAEAHVLLAEIMSEVGPPIAERHQFAYPAELERVARKLVDDELRPER